MEPTELGPSTYNDCFNAKKYLEDYYSMDPETKPMTIDTRFVITTLHRIFASGLIKGETMIELGAGPVLYHILSACDTFKKIYLTDYFDGNLRQIEKCLKKENDAFDWTPYMQYVCDLEGNRCTPEEKGEKIRSKVTLLKSDVTLANPLEPVSLPKVDFVMIGACLTCACKNEEEFTASLKNIVSLIKPGGYLFIEDCLEASYYIVGDIKFSVLSLKEEMVRRAVVKAGCAIDEFEIFRDSQDSVTRDDFDRESVFCLLAHKLRK
uniref:Uncharacterized protein n=1 Tax=Leptobrachium leishanense TaxID=445787 RepID=A0A8C5PXC5_9ANUR